MHFHLPKPLHGWREFAGEVGIIVVGVLIALGAEQIVETLQWREKVRHAEQAMRLELAEDDGPQAYGRLLIAVCLDNQLARIHDNPRAGVSPDQLRDALPPTGDPSPADLQSLRRLTGQLRVLNDRISRGSQLFLARTQRLGAGVSALNRRSLQTNAKAIYGACAVAPNLDARPAAQTSTADLRGFVH
jgi:hypothetical protein